MSKTVVIQKSGTASTESSISDLDVNKVDSGSASWVPEDEVQLTELVTDENGTYTPDGYYAYGKVSVRSNMAYGRYNDKFWTVYRGEDGYLEWDEAPARIVIATAPTKLSYTVGETIDLTGISVVALKADGTTFSSVQTSELIVSPSTATSSTITVSWWYRLNGRKVKKFSATYNIAIG